MQYAKFKQLHLQLWVKPVEFGSLRERGIVMAEPTDNLDIVPKVEPLKYKALEPHAADAGHEPARPLGTPPPSTEPAVESRSNGVDRRTLIIGQGTSLTGEVGSCDRLIVEGSIQATLHKCQHVIIAETGLFNGRSSTENADVPGRFEGELVVRKRLLIRKGGHVSGTITYGEIEIEAGGTISGTIKNAGLADATSFSAAERMRGVGRKDNGDAARPFQLA
jgi:cytoskeletal protein CcmA (bactofilin family)